MCQKGAMITSSDTFPQEGGFTPTPIKGHLATSGESFGYFILGEGNTGM